MRVGNKFPQSGAVLFHRPAFQRIQQGRGHPLRDLGDQNRLIPVHLAGKYPALGHGDPHPLLGRQGPEGIYLILGRCQSRRQVISVGIPLGLLVHGAFEGPHLTFQPGKVPRLHRPAQGHHGGGHFPADLLPLPILSGRDGLPQLGGLRLQRLQPLAALHGGPVAVKKGHGGAGGDFLPLAGKEPYRRLRPLRLNGPSMDDLLLPDQISGGLHGVLHHIGVSLNGGVGVPQPPPGRPAHVKDDGGKEEGHNDLVQQCALLHSITSLFLCFTAMWLPAGMSRCSRAGRRKNKPLRLRKPFAGPVARQSVCSASEPPLTALPAVTLRTGLDAGKISPFDCASRLPGRWPANPFAPLRVLFFRQPGSPRFLLCTLRC